MKHRSSRELFAYWDVQRGLRAAPEHCEIDPGAIRRVLADTFVLAADDCAGYPFRIAGTRICSAFGRELKNESFIRLWRAQDRAFVGDLLAVVVHEEIGFVASARCGGAEGEIELELLALPLRHRRRPDARLLGALAPFEAPYWFGMSALAPLALGPHRFLALGASAAPAPAAARRHYPRFARGFLVYEGGQK
ncbi:MAG TPA: PAS domain-containing protein [Xanthobacteraceae bacterium]|jgi:hypothetical protein